MYYYDRVSVPIIIGVMVVSMKKEKPENKIEVVVVGMDAVRRVWPQQNTQIAAQGHHRTGAAHIYSHGQTNL
jgi:hypothetical protein